MLHISYFLDKSKHCELSSSEARSGIKTAQVEVSKLEENVKIASAEWEKACKSQSENPTIEIEKKIWKDFVNKPDNMERTVESMKAYLSRKNSNK